MCSNNTDQEYKETEITLQKGKVKAVKGRMEEMCGFKKQNWGQKEEIIIKFIILYYINHIILLYYKNNSSQKIEKLSKNKSFPRWNMLSL